MATSKLTKFLEALALRDAARAGGATSRETNLAILALLLAPKPAKATRGAASPVNALAASRAEADELRAMLLEAVDLLGTIK